MMKINRISIDLKGTYLFHMFKNSKYRKLTVLAHKRKKIYCNFLSSLIKDKLKST